MALLKFIIFALTLMVQGGSSPESIYVFYHPEQDATLQCEGPSSSRPQGCSDVSWLYNRIRSETIQEVKGGNFMSGSGRGDRLTLNPDCSLVIRSITVEDVGLYTCRRGNDDYYDVNVYLSTLTVRLDPDVSEGRTEGEVKLECTLFRYEGLPGCKFNSLRWLDDSGFELTKGVQKFSRGTDCLSDLTVKLESRSSRRFICQSVNRDNKVEIQAEYTAGFKGPGPALTPAPDPTFIIVGVLLGVLLLLVVTSAVLIKHRRRGVKGTEGQLRESFDASHEDVQTPPQPPDEPESDVTYVSVSHIQHQEKKKKKTVQKEEEEEEGVTYSAIRSGVRTATDDDPSSLYSNVIRPK
ncbi:uncharacterized protein LOC141802088 [Halichoeres trimaculatus]|uniref:uncharacterized protein LOC141802088 n=1 Tax=Halichoeres trimaculatus TaxID=147232 RepID=UPI003D9DD7ED